MLERREKPTPDMFGELLQNASTMGDLRNCPVSMLNFLMRTTDRTEELIDYTDIYLLIHEHFQDLVCCSDWA